MTVYQLPYGKSFQPLDVDEPLDCDAIQPNFTPPAPNPEDVITASLDQALSFDIRKFDSKSRVAIAINDKTRPVPHHEILPPLLAWLEAQGFKSDSIHLWIATGSHTPMHPAEIQKMLPERIVQKYKVQSHNIDDLENLQFLGTTSRGTPIIVNKHYYTSDLKITVGDIEPHHFAGFSGGYKTAAIGLAGRETINRNHALLVERNAWIGMYEDNPLRMDIEEIGQKIGVQLALNTILNSEKGIVASFAGQPGEVMKAGIPVSRRVCGTPCSKKYDIVVASAGGFPKDINFYQAQKALTHASLFARPGGTIILAAECPEGSGSAAYEDFMRGIQSVDEVFQKFSQMEFRVGPHKAFQVARLLKQFSIILVSGIPESKVSELLMTPAKDVTHAFNMAYSKHRHESCSVAILPHATTTIPFAPAGG